MSSSHSDLEWLSKLLKIQVDNGSWYYRKGWIRKGNLISPLDTLFTFSTLPCAQDTCVKDCLVSVEYPVLWSPLCSVSTVMRGNANNKPEGKATVSTVFPCVDSFCLIELAALYHGKLWLLWPFATLSEFLCFSWSWLF